jgi:mannose-1-phosphate guanylyltransferase
MDKSNTYALILAGGSGERFWPVSRNTHPKQLLKLLDDTSLLEQTLERIQGIVPAENILVLTNSVQEEEVRKLITSIPAENIIAEPQKRDTAPAIALAIGWVAARNPSANMIVLPADQLIEDTDKFHEVLAGAVDAAEHSGAIVTIGIKPTWACPSYGYIERGKRATVDGMTADIAVYEVKRFREKPNADLAEQFLSDGNFTWNAGMFIWSLPTVVSELTRHAPQLAEFINEVRRSTDLASTIKSQFGKLDKISIDYALMENASRVLNIEATFDWDDVGSWISVAKYLDTDKHNNATNVKISELDATGNVVFSKNPNCHIALLGVTNLIVVQTEDALLIVDKDQAERIKHLIKNVPKELL